MIRYNNLRLIPSKTAAREMLKHGFMTEDCKTTLENSYKSRKRQEDTTEKWMDLRSKTYNIIVVKSFNHFYGENVYLIKHFGMFTKKKGLNKKKCKE
ncbi:hypothetical protein HYX16_03710 [Candidatus Woesearchaeota archaeon]|nr:hypothetical protein [Candidatus Woesearchaeota archaeon]